jgi:hypothetical protein
MSSTISAIAGGSNLVWLFIGQPSCLPFVKNLKDFVIVKFPYFNATDMLLTILLP